MTKAWRYSVVCVATTVVAAVLFSASCWGDHAKPDVDMSDLSYYAGSSETTPYPTTSSRSVRNVIFMIGDGMGLSQVTLARMLAVGVDGKLYLERLPINGMIRTHSADNLVTDSAAGGTALACGVKTNNAMIGTTPDRTPYRSILRAAKAKGLATGLVATSAITHATPASFASNVRHRDLETRIAPQMIDGQVDLLFGGGRKFFLPRSEDDSPQPEAGSRRDGRNLLAEAADAGFTVAGTPEGFEALKSLPALALLQSEALTTGPNEPSLAALTSKAIDLLKDGDTGSAAHEGGFFLMVEGSQIDWACHDNDAPHAVWQVLHFDEAVKAAIDFALADGQTLVIVTADHETGGLTLPGGRRDGSKVDAEWSTDGHTGTPVPIYAFGPGAEDFGGIYDNTEVSKKIAALLGIAPWPQPME